MVAGYEERKTFARNNHLGYLSLDRSVHSPFSREFVRPVRRPFGHRLAHDRRIGGVRLRKPGIHADRRWNEHVVWHRPIPLRVEEDEGEFHLTRKN